MRTARLSTVLTALFAALLLLLTAQPAAPVVAAASAATDCEGAACPQVAVTFDETTEQYRIQNNSTDRWVLAEASNLAASASACLAPGKVAALPLKSIVGPYRADFAEERCGAQRVGE